MGLHQNPSWGTENKIQCVAHAFQFNEALSSGCFKSFCGAINSMHTIQPFLGGDRINYLLFYGYSFFQ